MLFSTWHFSNFTSSWFAVTVRNKEISRFTLPLTMSHLSSGLSHHLLWLSVDVYDIDGVLYTPNSQFYFCIWWSWGLWLVCLPKLLHPLLFVLTNPIANCILLPNSMFACGKTKRHFFPTMWILENICLLYLALSIWQHLRSLGIGSIDGPLSTLNWPVDMSMGHCLN